MGQHSIAEAGEKLSELIDRASKGEEITITSHGRVVARLVSEVSEPAAPQGRAMTDADWDRLAANRVGSKMPKEDAGTLVRRMRDEEWERF